MSSKNDAEVEGGTLGQVVWQLIQSLKSLRVREAKLVDEIEPEVLEMHQRWKSREACQELEGCAGRLPSVALWEVVLGGSRGSSGRTGNSTSGTRIRCPLLERWLIESVCEKVPSRPW